MRKIKFRAWDQEAKNMIDAESFYFSDELEPFVDSVQRAQQMFDIMQYTGLRDRKDKEIYEDDIIAKFDFMNPYFNSVVVYRLGSFGYAADGDFITFAHNSNFKWVNGKSEKIEIIGNIHENSELAESEQQGEWEGDTK